MPRNKEPSHKKKLELIEREMRDFIKKESQRLPEVKCDHCLQTHRLIEKISEDFATYQIIEGHFINVDAVWRNCDQDYVTNYFRNMKYNDFLKTKYWKSVSGIAKSRIKFCQLCSSTEKLQTHHTTYDILGRELGKGQNDNICDETNLHKLTVLCADCHEGYHKKIEKRS